MFPAGPAHSFHAFADCWPRRGCGAHGARGCSAPPASGRPPCCLRRGSRRKARRGRTAACSHYNPGKKRSNADCPLNKTSGTIKSITSPPGRSHGHHGRLQCRLQGAGTAPHSQGLLQPRTTGAPPRWRWRLPASPCTNATCRFGRPPSAGPTTCQGSAPAGRSGVCSHEGTAVHWDK